MKMKEEPKTRHSKICVTGLQFYKCLFNQITEPTRVTEKSKSFIDVILASSPESFATCGNLHLGVTDHD